MTTRKGQFGHVEDQRPIRERICDADDHTAEAVAWRRNTYLDRAGNLHIHPRVLR